MIYLLIFSPILSLPYAKENYTLGIDACEGQVCWMLLQEKSKKDDETNRLLDGIAHENKESNWQKSARILCNSKVNTFPPELPQKK